MVKRILLVLAVLFVIAQFIRPAMTNPPIDQSKTLYATTPVPRDVQVIINRACMDCHSSATVWPWYAQISPVSWMLANHVKDGRHQLSFSEWGTYTPKKRAHKLEEACDQVKQGDMPLPSYLIIHHNAKLSDADKKVFCDWATQEQARIKATMP